MIAPALAGAAAALAVFGRWYRRSLQRGISARYERSADGVIRGAEPISIAGSSGAAVLLVHGGGDTPQTMRHVATAFGQRGYTVAAPLLPGHGRDLASFDAHGADDWYDAVAATFARLRESHEWVGVVGLSMGGALSARLAADTQAVDSLVLVSPYLSMPAFGAFMARTSFAWGLFFPAVSTATDRSVFDPTARAESLAYGAFTHRSLRALQVTAARGRAALRSISAPTLVIQSTSDNRVSSAATRAAFEQIGAAEKQLEWIEGAGHVITVDFGWERVVERAAEWMERHREEVKAGRSSDAPLTQNR